MSGQLNDDKENRYLADISLKESTSSSNHTLEDIPLGTLCTEEKKDLNEKYNLEYADINDLQAESDKREMELLEAGRRHIMKLKRMEYKRKIGRVFTVIETFKNGLEGQNQVVDRAKYQWTDLHYASAKGFKDKLQELLDAGEDPNVLDDRGRTAIDVAGIAFYQGMKIENLYDVLRSLFSAGGKFNTMKGNIDDLDTPLHTAVELNCQESIKLLLDQGASVTCLNSAGLTPLHIGINKKNQDAFKILLKHSCANSLEVSQRACVRDISGFTLLQTAVVTEWIQGVQYLIDAGADITGSSHLPFELCNNVIDDDSSDFINRLEQIHETPIHLAAETGNRHILRKLITNKSDAANQFNHLGQTPLYIAIRSGNLGCVETLLNVGADILKVTNDNQNALDAAIQFGMKNIADFLIDYSDSHDIISTVLNSLNNVGYAPIHTAVAYNRVECIELLGKKHGFLRMKSTGKFTTDWTPLHIAAAKNFAQAAEIIMKFDQNTIEDVDQFGRSPIHLAAACCNREVMHVMLCKGAVLSSLTKKNKILKNNKDRKNVTAFKMISRELPNPTPFFEDVLDSFIDACSSDLPKESGNQVTIDYSVFTKVNGVSQIEVLEEIVKCDQQKLLIHPLVESLIYLKWRSLLPFFCVIVTINAQFTLSLYGLMLHRIMNADLQEEEEEEEEEWDELFIFLTPLVLIIFLEIMFISIHRTRYFKEFENWAKIFSICFAGYCLSPQSQTPESINTTRYFATGVLLCSWAQIMFLLSRFPYVGFYVLMFRQVSINILKILATFVFLLIAFSISFEILFNGKAPFDGPWSAFVRTIVMMTSEFDYDNLFGKNRGKEFDEFDESTQIIFLLFLLFVSIAFVNFMLGVAVSDVTDLKIDGDIRRLEKQVEYLSNLDRITYAPFVRKFLKKSFIDARFIKEIKIQPGKTKFWVVLYETKGNNAEIKFSQKELSLPSHILDNIFQKIKIKKEGKEEEQRVKLYRMKIDIIYEIIAGQDNFTSKVLDNEAQKNCTKFDGTRAMHLLKDLKFSSNETHIKYNNLNII